MPSAADGDSEQSWKTAIERALCLPLMLVANFVIALYFRAVYVSMTKRSRRSDLRALVLHASAFLSFATLVGFANQRDRVLRRMNDISEACIVLAFTSQISIITSDASKLCNLQSLRRFMHTAEFFCALAAVVILLSIAAIFDEDNLRVFSAAVEWHESLALIFIVSFRFYYITLSRGSLVTLLRQQPLETWLHALLVTHAYPFVIAKCSTGLALNFYQGLYLRVLVLLCAWATTREKKSDESKKPRHARGNTKLSLGRDGHPAVHHQRHLSSVVPQTSSRTHTRRASAKPSLMTVHSVKRMYRHKHPNIVFPDLPPVDGDPSQFVRAVSSVKSATSS